MNSTNTLDEEPYNQPLIYSDEASLLDLYHRLVRRNGWKEDYLAPSGASWPNSRVWNGNDFDIGYVKKGDARVNLIVQSSTPPFKLLVGYNVGEEFASMKSDYQIKQQINRAFEKTRETLSSISEVFENNSVTEYRVLIQSVDPDLDNPHQRADRLQQSISDSLDQPSRTLGYQTYPVEDGVERIVNFHDEFPDEEARNFRSLLIDD